MAVNDYVVGRDVTLDIITAEGSPVRFSKLTGFSSRQETTDIKVRGMDGTVTNLYLPDGWSGGVDIEQRDSKALDLACKLEADYYAGKNLKGSTITETVKFGSGAVGQYRYQEVVFKLDDAGDIKGDATVKQKITWMASRCIRVG